MNLISYGSALNINSGYHEAILLPNFSIVIVFGDVGRIFDNVTHLLKLGSMLGGSLGSVSQQHMQMQQPRSPMPTGSVGPVSPLLFLIPWCRSSRQAKFQVPRASVHYSIAAAFS